MDPKAIVTTLLMISLSLTVVSINGMDRSGEDPTNIGIWADDSYNFDFGSRDPLMQSYSYVNSTTVYSPARGYGLLEPANDFLVTPRMLVNQPNHVLERKWVYDEYGNDLTVDGLRSEEKVSFRVDLENGTYRVILWLGDLEKGIYSMNVSVNDQWVLQGANAFHTVHRSMYMKYQPDPRDPEKEYLNYGMAQPYYLNINVTEGFMIINVTGNDTSYWNDLAEELSREPAISYLTWMSTGGIKQSAGTGPWRYIGGPFTNASVLGLNIYPEPDFPIDGEIGVLTADPDIDAVEVLNGISTVNSGNLETAFLHWKNAMDDDLSGRNRLARSQLGLILAGSLKLDREIEILSEAETDLLTNTDMRGDPALAELWTWANQTNIGLKYEFERILYDELDPKNHFIEANKAYKHLTTVPEISPLYPKVRLWAARCLMNLDPHRWTSASGTALEMMEDLRPMDPDNPYIRMYLDTTREDPATWEIPTPVISTTGVYDNWTLNDYNIGYGNAPKWATIIHEELGWLYDVTDWWVENRMQENGYLGGGWTDDVEMIGLFGFDALISEGADDLSLDGAGRFVDGMLESGQVDMDLGFSEAFADVEHTAELTGDSLPMMIAVDFGNPKWVEFSTKTAVLMRDLWMDENEKGWYQFKSNYLSATQIGTGGRAEDSWINFRAVLPALWAWWYSNDPEVQKLIIDWADGWVNAAISTEKGKPMGVIPAGIGWPDGEIGGHNSPNWYTAAHPSGSVNYDWGPQKYKSYIVTLLETAFDATGNMTFLKPLKLEAQIAQEYIDDPDPGAAPGTSKWAGKILGSSAVSTYQSLLDKYQLPGGAPSSTLWRPISVVSGCENGYDYIRKCYPLMTTEASATDRALFVGVVNPFLIYTGGSIGGALLAPQFTYSGLGRDFAAMVRDANARTANISMYGFFEGIREAGIMPWALEIGGNYSITVGPDADSDGVMDSADSTDHFIFLTRGQKIPISLPGDMEYLVTISQVEEGSGVRPLMPDPAFNEEEEVNVDKENGTVTIKVHNIGSEDVEKLDIYLYEDLDGGLRHIGGAMDVSIPPPSGLQPSIEEVNLTVWKEPWIGEVVILIDPDDDLMEICESNNELRGYWDLEGILVNPPDQPIVMNGTIPVVDVYEDTLAYDILDLSEFIWDPDGRGLNYYVGPTHYSFPWLTEMNGSKVSFHPSPLYGENYSGQMVFNGSASGPGRDGLWDTFDDTPVYGFNVTLRILSVNDPPELTGVRVNGTLIKKPSNGSFSFQLWKDTTWNGELVLQDVDNDPVNVTLGIDDDRFTLDGYNLTVNGTGWNTTTKIVPIEMDDGSGNITIEEIEFNLLLHDDPPEWVGVKKPDGTVIPAQNNFMKIMVKQGEDMNLELLVNPPENISFSMIIGHDDVFLSGGFVHFTPNQSHVRIKIDIYPDFSIIIRAADENGLYSDLTIQIFVLDVNDVPSAPDIYVFEGPHYEGDDVVFATQGSTDIDGDPLEYNWDFGDGNSTGWGNTRQLYHAYETAGNYTVTLHVRDGRGGENSTSITVGIIEKEDPIPSDDDQDDDEIDEDDEKYPKKSTILIFLAVMVLMALAVFLILIFIMRRIETTDHPEE